MSEDAAEFNGAESQNVEEKPEVMLAEERGQRETRTEIDHQVGACSNQLECLDPALKSYGKYNFLSALTATPGLTYPEIILVLTVRHDSGYFGGVP